MRLAVLMVGLATAGLGCEPPAVATVAAVSTCVPGHSAGCTCVDGSNGAQRCNPEGAYADCVCEAPKAAPASVLPPPKPPRPKLTKDQVLASIDGRHASGSGTSGKLRRKDIRRFKILTESYDGDDAVLTASFATRNVITSSWIVEAKGTMELLYKWKAKWILERIRITSHKRTK